jgi:hypothetical protein
VFIYTISCISSWFHEIILKRKLISGKRKRKQKIRNQPGRTRGWLCRCRQGAIHDGGKGDPANQARRSPITCGQLAISAPPHHLPPMAMARDRWPRRAPPRARVRWAIALSPSACRATASGSRDGVSERDPGRRHVTAARRRAHVVADIFRRHRIGSTVQILF